MAETKERETRTTQEEEVTKLGTGELEVVPQTIPPPERTVAPPIASTTVSSPPRAIKSVAPPPAPEVSLLPDTIYYALYVGKKPATSVQEAVQAINLDLQFEKLQSFTTSLPGVYCLGRPARVAHASTLDPTAADYTISYIKVDASPQDKPLTWRREVFFAYANEQSQKEIAELKKENNAAQRKGLKRALLGYGLGLAGATMAVAVSWGLKGYVDSGRYFEANLASAQNRETFAKGSLDDVALQLKNVEQQVDIQTIATNKISQTIDSVVTRSNIAKTNSELARTGSDSALASVVEQETLLNAYWEETDLLEARLKIASENAASNLYSLHTQQRILDAWDELGNRTKNLAQYLHARFPAYMLASSVINKMAKSNSDMNHQFVNYIREIKQLTNNQLKAAITIELTANPNPQLLHNAATEYAAYLAENTSTPPNQDIHFEGGKINITANNCADAITTLGNIFNLTAEQKVIFNPSETTFCAPKGVDIRTTPGFKSYSWGRK